MDDIKKQVRQLDHGQLVELQTYIKGLMVSGGAKEAPAAEGLLLPVFENSCRSFGLGFVSPLVKALVRKRELMLKAFLDRTCPGSAAVIRRSILATAIDLLYEDLNANGRIINVRSLAYSLDRIPPILDRAFPGYAASGLLPKIVRAAA